MVVDGKSDRFRGVDGLTIRRGGEIRMKGRKEKGRGLILPPS
jgi:hypothetical protein